MIDKIINKLTKQGKLEEFATDNGWKDMIMTETESPNYEIKNPIRSAEYLREKFNAPVLEAYKAFKLKDANAIKERKVRLAHQEFEQAKNALSIDEIVI